MRGNIPLALLILGALASGVLVLGPKSETRNVVVINPNILAAAAADAFSQKIPEKTVIPPFCPSFARTLNKGSADTSSNKDVFNLQKFLLQFTDIYPNGLVDGSFGSTTEAAVGRFQVEKKVAKRGDSGYGVLGPKTRTSVDIICGRKTAVSTPTPAPKPTPNWSYRVNVNTSVSGGAEKISVHAEAVNKGASPAIVSVPTACSRFTELLKQIDILDGKNISAVFPCTSIVAADSVSPGTSRAWDYVSRSGTTTPTTSSGGLSIVPGAGGYYSAPYSSPAVAFNVRVETQIDGPITSYLINVIAENRGSTAATIDTTQSCPSIYNAISSFGISVQPSNLFSCDSRLAGVYLTAGEKKTFQSTYRLGSPLALSGTLSVNVATTKGNYAPVEDITFIATLQNGTGADKTISASGCGEAAVVSFDVLLGNTKVNTENSATCQAFVFLSIPSGGTKTIPVTYHPTTPLVAGSYGLTARVSGFGSAATSFTVASSQICPAVANCPAGFTGTTSTNSNGCSVINCIPNTSSCQADISAAASAGVGQICGQFGPAMRCPSDSSVTVETLNTCTSGYLQSRGWTNI